jgi:hypothetical protein
MPVPKLLHAPVIPALTSEEKRIFSKLNTYLKIQDFLEGIEYNLEEKGDTFYSPRQVLREMKANCIEGAIFAAACLYYNGQPPILGQLIAHPNKDDDHVLALYAIDGRWGSISKTKYPALSFREPIFLNLRELSLTYFESYFSYEGEKSLIGYTKPVDLRIFDKKGWITEEKNIKYISDHLCKSKTIRLLSKKAEQNLKPVTPLMKEAGEIWVNKKRIMPYLKKKFKEQ